MAVRPFYDPTFDPGAAVAVTYWTSFVGTRSKLNQERMAARLARADPKFYQEQLESIQENINELMLKRQQAGNDTLTGMNRFLSDYTKAEGQLRKATVDREASEIDARARIAVARIGGLVDLDEISAENRRFFAEMSNIEAADFEKVSQAIEVVAANRSGDLNELQEVEQNLYDKYGTRPGAPMGRIIKAMIAEQILGAQAQNPNDTRPGRANLADYATELNDGMTPEQVHRDVGALFVDPALDQERRDRLLSIGAGGGGGGGGSSQQVLDRDPADDPMFRTTFDYIRNQGATTQAQIDRAIEEQRAKMREVEAARDRAMADADAIYTSSTRNPFLQPVFFQSSPARGRVRQQQDVVDAAARTARRDPTGTDLATRMREFAEADGNINELDPLDTPGPQKNIRNASADTGEFLYSYIYRELDKIGKTLDGNPQEAQRRFFDLYRIVNAVPFDDMNPAVKSSMEDAVEAFRTGDVDAMRSSLTTPPEGGTGSLLERVRSAYDAGDIHFAQIVADSITDAETAGAGSEDAAEIIYNLVNFADVAGDLGGSLGGALVNVYDQVDDPDVLQRAFQSAKSVADDSMMEFEDDDFNIVVPPLGRSVLEQQEADRNLTENANTPTLEYKTPSGSEFRGGATEASPVEQQSTVLLERGDTSGTRVTVDPDGSQQTALGQQAARPYEREPVPPPTPRQAAAARRQQRRDERPSTQEERQANRQQRRAERAVATAPPNKALSPDKPALVKPRPAAPEPVRSKPVEDVFAEALAPEPEPEVAAAPAPRLAPQAEPAPEPADATDRMLEAPGGELPPDVVTEAAGPRRGPAPRPAAAQDTSDPFWAKPVRSQNVMARDLERRVVVPEYTPEMERRAATVLRQIIVDGLDDGEAMPNITDRQLLEMARSFRPLVVSGGYKALDNQINSERDQMYAPTGMTWFEYHEKADREGRTDLSEALDRQAQAVNRRSRYLTDRQYERRREADQQFRDVVRQAGVQTFFQDVFTTFEEMQDYDSAFIPLLPVPPAN